MIGVCCAYVTFLIPNIDQLENKTAEVWAWLARILNNQEVSAITADIVLMILKIAGHSLLQRYGQQFRKVLQFIQEEYLRRIPPNGDNSRLRLVNFLEKYVSDNGNLEKPADPGLFQS